MLSYRWDQRRTLWIPGDRQSTIDYATRRWVESARAAIRQRNRFAVALSGGSTPKKIFETLVEQYRDALPWNQVVLFWSDERSVSPSNPDSNFHMAWVEAGLETLPIRSVYRMVAESDLEANSQAYEKNLHAVLGNDSLDLIMLGMGDDGHTASLFPNTAALHESTRGVVANYVPQHATWRMTFTYSLIHRAREVCVYVIGKNKAERVHAVLCTTDSATTYPVQSIGSQDNPASWILDEEAASLLTFPQ